MCILRKIKKNCELKVIKKIWHLHLDERTALKYVSKSVKFLLWILLVTFKFKWTLCKISTCISHANIELQKCNVGQMISSFWRKSDWTENQELHLEIAEEKQDLFLNYYCHYVKNFI